ncbi:MAG: RNA polymerase sigma factor [Myxococcota bacterium]
MWLFAVSETAPRTLTRPALEALYARLEKPMFNVVLRWVWDREEARDVVHDAFVRVWQRRAKVDEATVEPYLWQVALNVAANRRRGKRLKAFFGLDAAGDVEAPGASSEDALAKAQASRAVRAAIDALPEKLKVVVVMCELSGLSYDEVARTLGIPAGTVGSRRAAAMEKLAAALGPLEEVPT